MAGPVQPTFSTATWSFVIADRSLVNTAFLTPHPEVVRYTRRESDYCEMAIQVRNREDLNALEAAAYSKVLRAWRNGVNRFNGEFVEIRETADAWELVAKDPFFNLNWRDIRAKVRYKTEDSGQIAWELIALQNTYFDTHLRQGTTDATAEVTRDFLPGERVSEKIQLLSSTDDAFHFTINGYDGPPDAWATFRVHNPVVNMPLARFEFGNGTLENCDDYLRESLPLVNRINIVGESPNMVVTATGATSPAAHGLWEGDRGQVMTNVESQLTEIAAGAVTDAVQYSITMSAGPEAPQLFTDFDVGNTVPCLIRRAGRTIQGNKRVKEATVLLDVASGAEELESLEVYE